MRLQTGGARILKGAYDEAKHLRGFHGRWVQMSHAEREAHLTSLSDNDLRELRQHLQKTYNHGDTGQRRAMDQLQDHIFQRSERNKRARPAKPQPRSAARVARDRARGGS